MDKRQKEAVLAIGNAIKPLGWNIVGTTRHRGHLKITIQDDDATIARKLVCSASPSDHRALKNLVATAKRICKENMQ